MTPQEQPRPKRKLMWAVLHVPSNTWGHGDANETLYWARHAAQCQCPNDAFRPVPVEVVLLTEEQATQKEAKNRKGYWDFTKRTAAKTSREIPAWRKDHD